MLLTHAQYETMRDSTIIEGIRGETDLMHITVYKIFLIIIPFLDLDPDSDEEYMEQQVGCYSAFFTGICANAVLF